MVALLGIPFEKPCPRPGCSLGPEYIRKALKLLERYSPDYGRVAEYDDMGDIYIKNLHEITEAVAGIREPLLIGGDHSITIPAAKTIKPEEVLFIDAHLDRRDDYMGDKYSHACVSSRINAKIHYLGARSGSEEEWGVKVYEHPKDWPLSFGRVYITIDIDVFDPAFAPGVSYPEPGGITPREFFSWLKKAEFEEILCVDVVECNPLYDPSGITAFLAAKIIREIIAKWNTIRR